ncbi:putative sporulation protein YtxC [Polycladomyces sp. WAk]|uniref:Sporulation protein YtxC n=1 Tax=Polycladomyces zharkentensis TaxID=2807616 RepID=A0ABS2WI06_9BACL|nr:putative sporulation protein YtxC [Polycladomyces sp. WAk]MBN2909044.1 putative sporulation protein YtxC [Polycladomyces sp. WAk]
MAAYLITLPNQARNEVDQLRRCLNRRQEHLTAAGWDCRLQEWETPDRVVFRFSCLKRGTEAEKTVCRELGKGIAHFILSCREPAMIRSLIRRGYQAHQPGEIARIEAYADRIANEKNKSSRLRLQRKEKIARHLERFLHTSSMLSVDGFITFRLKSYLRALRKLVNHAIDEYLLDQEYKEFIQLLRYFVSMQKPKVQLVHVLHEGDRCFQLLQSDGKPLIVQEADSTIDELMEQAFSHEDLIVSTLLTVAPEQVILHTRHEEANVVRTLKQVFEGRIHMCRGCARCGEEAHSHSDA